MENSINWTTVLVAFIAFLGTVVTVVGGIYLAKIANSVKRAAQDTQDTAVSVEKIHKAVNSTATAQVEKIDALQEQIRLLTKSEATLKEQSKG